MRKLTPAACLLLATLNLLAQNDSSRLDAGSLVLKRNFTQYISIKGTELEKMPFSNLADAINVWISGAYTVNQNLIYVVDGNIVNDVHAYSIHDIEEVVFLQNAGALTGTATSQQEMVLITTHNAAGQLAGRPGIRASTQNFLVKSPGATTEFYYHNYFGADARINKFTIAVSADWLQDAVPMVRQKDFTSLQAFTMDRWRLNGTVGWQPNKKNEVELHVGYAPENLDSARSYALGGQGLPRYKESGDESDKQFNSWARWRGEWLPGLRNDLQVGYLHFTQTGDYFYLGQQHNGPSDTTTITAVMEAAGAYRIRHFYIRDRISYSLHAGDWSFEPFFNASYQSAKQAYGQASFAQSGQGAGGGGGLGTQVSNSIAGAGQTFELYVLTPQLDISYKQVLNIQGGIVANVSHNDGGAKTILPRTVGFGSVAIDILRLACVNSQNSMKLFGSYAQRSSFNASDFSLNDVGNANPPFKFPMSTGFFQPVLGSYYSGNPGTPVASPTAISIPRYWVWEAGVRWSLYKDRLQIEYNFQRRNFSTLYYSYSGGFTTLFYADWHSDQHRLAVNVHIFDSKNLRWQSGLNTTVLRSKELPYFQSVPIAGVTGDHFPGNNKPSFTGGWTNRVQCHRMSVGLDLLYHFSGENLNLYLVPPATSYSRDNAWLAQNIYVAYKLPSAETIGLEIYLDSRGLVRGGNAAYMAVPARYYGIGGKVSF